MYKILDCTLRDGGYINNWNFKYAPQIISALQNANFDYIECGFLSENKSETQITVFNGVEQINEHINADRKRQAKIAAMILWGNFDANKIPKKTSQTTLDAIRVTFKKYQSTPALKLIKDIKNKGYEAFINPSNIDLYTKDELLELINKANSIIPKGISIVDTKGALHKEEILELFQLFDKNLNTQISLCLHTHNNMGLCEEIAKHVIKANFNREIIIDSALFGMSRGPGTLKSEFLAQYLNTNKGAKYNTDALFNATEKYIKPILKDSPWGYSPTYHLVAKMRCHPNYASFFIEKNINSQELIKNLLKQLPEDKKSHYDEDFIKTALQL